MSKKGWVRKSTEDEYPTGGGACQKRGGSESQQKMNIRNRRWAMSKKGRIRNVNWDPTRKT